MTGEGAVGVDDAVKLSENQSLSGFNWSGLMGHIGHSSRRGVTGDAAHRPSVATHTKCQGVPPKAALPRPPTSLRGLPDAPTSRGTARLAGGRGSAVKPLQLNPERL